MPILIFLILLFPLAIYAGPSSTNYELQQYSFGSAGTDTSLTSTNYGLFFTLGQSGDTSLSSANFQTLPGLVYQIQSPLPPAPSLSNNDSKYYDKLHVTINYSTAYGSIPSDILFAIAVSTDNFSTDIKYVQADQTLSTTPVWQSYTTWGGSSGFDLLGLTKDTIYWVKVAAKQGSFTQTGFGPSATLPTAEDVTLTFDLLTSSLSLGNLTPGSVVTSASEAEISITTNSNSGALIYVYGSNSGLKSQTAGNYTIDTVTGSADLTGLSQGYGIRGTSVTQTLGQMVIEEPYNGSGNTVGQIDSQKRILFHTDDAPIESGTGKFEVQAKSSLTTPPASDYSDTITVAVAGTF